MGINKTKKYSNQEIQYQINMYQHPIGCINHKFPVHIFISSLVDFRKANFRNSPWLLITTFLSLICSIN